MGDNAYSTGTITEYTDCYEPSWGAFKARTYPAMGNHDAPNQATGYFPYFSATPGGIGSPDGYYSYDQGPYWHVIVLNSEADYSVGSAQEIWLRADLAANADANVLAYWHTPRFSSDDTHGTEVAAGAIWDALYEYGADLALNGHAHWYERFAPQTPDGVADPTYGIPQITVGTGGKVLRGLGTIDPNSEVRDWSTWGVLKLTLNQSSYDWEFVPVVGSSFTDSGSMTVHGAPAAPNTPPDALDDAYSTPQGTALNEPAPGVLGNDSDVDGDPLSAVLDTDVSNGTLTLNADGSFVYTPDALYTGPTASPITPTTGRPTRPP